MNINEILLADDDSDDCLLFKEALEELKLPVNLTMVNDGEALMNLLAKKRGDALPCVLFLDLNMPRKSGFDCLREIKQSEKLKHLSVIIYSTSYDPNTVDSLYTTGAMHYIRKPSEFSKLKEMIGTACKAVSQSTGEKTTKENFVLLPKIKNDGN